uniref:Large ribosomal subunit protein uL3 n=1 Tax=uncultured Chloroflexi bacterium Rifle_16ft_4_minimus_3189 TaxID=1665068 RepID=A0A0H4T2Z6_9CHLR|nr:50S ribosomal protein L3, large subunit ribosomal protein L3 [uncultured Chloroflexi bacterium Rifle_16ft_4_minimus_3189]
MKGILGRKIGMTQIFAENGERIPVTVIEAGPCYVTQVRTVKENGYNAIQIGFDPAKRAQRLSRGERGHLGLLKPDEKHPKRRKLPTDVPPLKSLREIRVREDEHYTEGQIIKADIFEVGERVDVIGTSKGRGFAGTVKRHGFSGGFKTHGQSDRMRAPGSIGAGTTPGKVIKGKKMAGHMGTDSVTAQHLDVILVDAERNLIGVRGSVPGANGDLVLVRETRKK